MRELDSQEMESVNGGGTVTWVSIAGGAAITVASGNPLLGVLAGQTYLDPAEAH